MKHKIIAIATGYPENTDLRHIPVECEPDRNAPSVSEIVEVMREAGCLDCDGSGWLPVKGNGQSIKCEWCRNRDNLINRLEDA